MFRKVVLWLVFNTIHVVMAQGVELCPAGNNIIKLVLTLNTLKLFGAVYLFIGLVQVASNVR